jgi:hypothetical protein
VTNHPIKAYFGRSEARFSTLFIEQNNKTSVSIVTNNTVADYKYKSELNSQQRNEESMGKKREISIFDAVEELETQDRLADGKRQKKNIAEQKRAIEVQNQTKVFHHLVESRILLQRAVTSVNKNTEYEENENEIDSSSLRDTCNTLLEKLLVARNQLSGKQPEDDDDDDDDDHDKYKGILASSSSSELHQVLQDEYEEQKGFWEKVFNQRHKNLRLHSGLTAKSQFKVMDSSFWEQVDATMEYEEIRSKNNNENNSDEAGGTLLFDDSKVYQQLLKDFVANSVPNSGDVNAAAERLRATKQKNKSTKTDVDRRASKGRKIRYKEVPKLVNFTFPLSRPNASTLNQDEYFQSLFGGTGVSSSS